MAQCRLRSYEIPLPGGYHYEQSYPGGVKKFYAPFMEALAQQIWVFRVGNSLPGATLKESLIDGDHFNAERLGCHRLYTVRLNPETQHAVALNAAISPTVTPCKGCGGTVLQG